MSGTRLTAEMICTGYEILPQSAYILPETSHGWGVMCNYFLNKLIAEARKEDNDTSASEIVAADEDDDAKSDVDSIEDAEDGISKTDQAQDDDDGDDEKGWQQGST